MQRLIESLKYSNLKKDKIIPSDVMFNNISSDGKYYYNHADMANIFFTYHDILNESSLHIDPSGIIYIDRFEENMMELLKNDGGNDDKYLLYIKNWITSDLPNLTFCNVSYNKLSEDIMIENQCIYKIIYKNKFNAVRTKTILYLLLYYALANINNIKITEIGIILPVQKIIQKVKINNFNYKPFLDLIDSKYVYFDEDKCKEYLQILYQSNNVGKYIKYMDDYTPVQQVLTISPQFTRNFNNRVYMYSPKPDIEQLAIAVKCKFNGYVISVNNIDFSEYASLQCPLLLRTDSNPQDIVDMLPKDNCCVCLDTYSLFSNGYDIFETLKLFEENNISVRLVHLNDCYDNKRVYFGHGIIGIDVLYKFAELCMSKNIDMIL